MWKLCCTIRLEIMYQRNLLWYISLIQKLILKKKHRCHTDWLAAITTGQTRLAFIIHYHKIKDREGEGKVRRNKDYKHKRIFFFNMRYNKSIARIASSLQSSRTRSWIESQGRQEDFWLFPILVPPPKTNGSTCHHRGQAVLDIWWFFSLSPH